MIWKRFLGAKPRNPNALPLYRAIVAQARQPGLYRDLGLPDNLDGRFEAIVLHLVLVLRRLKRDFPAGSDLAEALRASLDRERVVEGKRVIRLVECWGRRITT